MKNKTNILQYTLLAVILLVISSCSSSVRFSSDVNNSYSSSSGTGKTKNKENNNTIFQRINKSKLNSTQQKILDEAEQWLGTPYCWGGESKDCADCSGFVMEVYKKAGILLPRTAQEQFSRGNSRTLSNAKAGDLIFFKKGSKITHVGIFIGDGIFIHSSSSKGVIVQDLDSFGSSPKFAGIKSVL